MDFKQLCKQEIEYMEEQGEDVVESKIKITSVSGKQYMCYYIIEMED